MRKIVYLEFLRVICAIVVLLDHICIAGIHIFGSNASQFDHFFYNGAQHWSHFAVPVFLMITGYLLLDPKREISYHKVITKYAWRMVAILLTVGTAFAWMEVYFSTKSLAPSGLLAALWNTIQGNSWKHLWYLYTLVGLYLILPAIKPIFEKLSTKELDAFLLITFIFGSVLPMVKEYTGFNLGVAFPLTSIYLFYFMIGRRIGVAEDMVGKRLSASVVAFIVLSIVQFVFAYFEHYNSLSQLSYASSYSSPLIVLIGILLFYCAKSMNVRLEKCYSGGAKIAIEHLSKNSFGIYVFHMLWVNVIYKVVKFCPMDYGIWIILILCVIILVLSDITTIVFRKIPWIGKYI